jgi:hypothetical protein
MIDLLKSSGFSKTAVCPKSRTAFLKLRLPVNSFLMDKSQRNLPLDSLEPDFLRLPGMTGFIDDDCDELLRERWSTSVAVPAAQCDKRRRCTYGQGIDAKRTRKYREYELTTSPMYTLLERTYARVTHSLLLELIDAVIAESPPQFRPHPPDRNQRRAKGGLVAWLDANQCIVVHYLLSRHRLN